MKPTEDSHLVATYLTPKQYEMIQRYAKTNGVTIPRAVAAAVETVRVVALDQALAMEKITEEEHVLLSKEF